MPFSTWLRKRTSNGIPSDTARRFHPRLEALEGRDVPSFSPAASYPLGSPPQAVVTADVNNDGKLDLLTADPWAHTDGVMLGKGNGTFGAVHSYAAGASPSSLAVGDLNNDGQPVVVTADAGDNSVSVLLGNGKGGFGPAQYFSVGPAPTSLALANFNGDGKLDVATFGTDQLGSGSTVSVLLGNGNGTFAAARIYAADAGAVTILAADLNGDGTVDLVTAQQGGPSVSLRLGAGDGTFGPAQFTAISTSASNPSAASITVGDFNGDGSNDLAVADFGAGAVEVLLNSTGGGHHHR